MIKEFIARDVVIDVILIDGTEHKQCDIPEKHWIHDGQYLAFFPFTAKNDTMMVIPKEQIKSVIFYELHEPF